MYIFGGYRAYLSLEEEEELLCKFDEICDKGEMCETSRIKKAHEEKVGKKAHETTIYRLMARHKFRKIAPYQRHHEGDIAEQEN